MRHKMYPAVLILACALASCAPGNTGIASMVPAEAIAFVQVTDLNRFFTSADEFTNAISLEEWVGPFSFRDMLSLALLSGNAGLSIEDVDLTMAAGAAILPPPRRGAEPGIVLYIPFKNHAKSAPLFQELLNQAGFFVATEAGGYSIFHQGMSDTLFPPEKAITSVSGYTTLEGSLSLYVDTAAFLRAYESEWEDLRHQDAELGDTFFELLEDVRSVTTEILVNKAGLKSKVTVEVEPESELAPLMSAAGTGGDLIRGLSLVPEGYLFSGSYRIDPAYWEKVYNVIAEMFESMPDTKGMGALLTVFKESLRFLGTQATFAVDMDMDPALFSEFQTNIPEDLSQLIEVRAVMSVDLTDGRAYLDWLRSTFAGPQFKNALNALTVDMGLSITPIVEEKKEGSFEYLRLSYLVKPNGIAPDISGSQSDNEAFSDYITGVAPLLDRLALNIAVKGNRAYMTVGDTGLEALQAISTQDKIEPSLAGNKALQDFLASAPSGTQMVTTFSMGKLVGIIADGMGITEVPGLDSSEHIMSYTKMDGTSMEMGTSWASESIAPVVRAIMESTKSIFDIVPEESGAF